MDSYEPLPPKADRSIAGLIGDLASEASQLFRQEIALAKAEIADKATRFATGIGLIAAGAFLGFAGLLVLLASAVLGLSLVLPAWAAALIVSAAVLAIATILAVIGKRNMAAEALVPSRTLKTLREDADWAKEQLR